MMIWSTQKEMEEVFKAAKLHLKNWRIDILEKRALSTAPISGAAENAKNHTEYKINIDTSLEIFQVPVTSQRLLNIPKSSAVKLQGS
jgi:hypothetical protein